MHPEHEPDANELDRYWDSLLRGGPKAPSPGLDPLSRAIVRHLAERPPEREVADVSGHVWVRLLASRNGSAPRHEPLPLSPPDAGAPAAPKPAMPRPARPRGTITRLSSILSMAAVVALMLAGLAVGFEAELRGLFSPGPGEAGWPVARGNNARTGAVDGLDFTTPPVVRWTYDAGGQIAAPPIADGDRVYVATTDVIALDAATGAEQWRFATDGNVSALVLDDGRLFAAGSDGNLYALDPESGAERWRAAINPARGSSIVAGDEAIHVVTTGGEVVALDAESGAERWRTAVADGGLAAGAISVDAGVVVVAVSNQGLTALQASDGAPRWTAPIISQLETIIDAPVIVEDEDMVFVSWRDKVGNTPEGKLAAYRLENGALAWSFALPETTGIIAPAAVAGGVVVVAGADRMLRALDPETGAVRWSAPAGAAVLQPVTVAGETVYAVGVDRVLRAFALGSVAELWSLKIEAGNLAGGAVVAGDALLGATADGVVMALGEPEP
jgi:outer membrane protein assembly factor BamB